MCGITGVFAFNYKGQSELSKITASVNCLRKRGPDGDAIFMGGNIALGHTRLAVIDTSSEANQPMTDASGRYTIVFNGEFFNYREHRQALLSKGISLKSHSDTEVLLNLFILEGPSFLQKINGFFAFAIYDSVEENIFLARDRMGIKPLLIYSDENKFIFSSEMKGILAFGIPKVLDHDSLLTYLQLNYIPAPDSIFRDVKKMEPGTWIRVKKNTETETKKYYNLPLPGDENLACTFPDASKKLETLLEQSVVSRLVSDVPLGAFLSGGVDSSVIVALASRHVDKLNTFSIGFKDEPLFDETPFAETVAKKFNTNHASFLLTNDDLFSHLQDVLSYIDEPFADSSALPVYILSKYTKKHVTVALSGDGADELFGGYHKHRAQYMATQPGFKKSLVTLLKPIWEYVPKSRNSTWGNKIRQLHKFSEGMKLSPKERYWRWASYCKENEAEKLTINDSFIREYPERKKNILRFIQQGDNMNEVLYTDLKLVLQNDMLTKVDLMSMANGLEIRVPFLDYRVVDFVTQLPGDMKIDHHMSKKILKETFRTLFSEELLTRKKQGFEVPLLHWFRTELKSMICDDLLSDQFIREQNLFNVSAVQNLKTQLFSNDPADSTGRIWGLIVFQFWWKKYMID